MLMIYYTPPQYSIHPYDLYIVMYMLLCMYNQININKMIVSVSLSLPCDLWVPVSGQWPAAVSQSADLRPLQHAALQPNLSRRLTWREKLDLALLNSRESTIGGHWLFALSFNQFGLWPASHVAEVGGSNEGHDGPNEWHVNWTLLESKIKNKVCFLLDECFVIEILFFVQVIKTCLICFDSCCLLHRHKISWHTWLHYASNNAVYIYVRGIYQHLQTQFLRSS